MPIGEVEEWTHWETESYQQLHREKQTIQAQNLTAKVRFRFTSQIEEVKPRF